MQRTSPHLVLATAAMCAVLLTSPALFWLGGRRKVDDHDTLVTAMMLVRSASIVGFVAYIGVFYARRWPTSVAGIRAWTSPIAALNVAGVLLIAIGQWLNFLVYMRLGRAGVYYGYEYGLVASDRTISEGFPFKQLHHPQYVGCMLTILGLWAFSGLDRDGLVRWPVAAIAATGLASYLIARATEPAQPGA